MVCAAYLSAWQGEISVALPPDGAQYEAMLDERQAASALRQPAGAELFELLVFLFELLHHFVDGGFELVAFH